MLLLESLPPELIDNICGYCELRSIKSLRLTCRYLKGIADSHLLDIVHILLAESSIQTAEYIADHTGLRKGPHTLYLGWDSSTPIPFLEWSLNRVRQDYQQRFTFGNSTYSNSRRRGKVVPATIRRLYKELSHLAPLLERRETQSHGDRKALSIISQIDAASGISPEDIQARYRVHVSLAEEVRLMMAPGKLRQRLRHVLQKCRSLNSVILRVGGGVWENPQQPYVDAPRYQAFDKGLLLPSDVDRSQCGSGVASMVELVHAASDAAFSPKNLWLGWVSHRLLMEDEIKKELSLFMQNVEFLHWVFGSPIDVDGQRIDDQNLLKLNFEKGAFLRFIANAENLARLYLELPEEDSHRRRANLKDMLGGLNFPKLTVFEVDTINAESRHLSNFLLRHTATLESLRLAAIDLVEGDWQSFFESIAGRMKKLSSVELRESLACLGEDWYHAGLRDGLRDRGYCIQLEEYLLMGGEFPEMPVPEDETEEEEHIWSPVSELGNEVDAE